MQLLKFIFSKTFIINLIIALLLVAGAIFGTVKWLDSYTLHGESITVPSLEGMKINELEEFLQSKELNYEITDSVYVANQPKGIVLEQNPKPESQVKKNRTIYITVTKTVAPQIFLPDITDMSVRMALSKLQAIGLKAGELIYRPANCVNCIVGMEYKGKEVTPGFPVKKGAKIDLLVGHGTSDQLIQVPYVIGLSYAEAQQKLKQHYLNIGGEIYDNCLTAQDSTIAKIYKQQPQRSPKNFLPMGSAIDIWLTCDTTKIQIDSLLLLGLDTLKTDTNIITNL